jgi:hypothetical protein
MSVKLTFGGEGSILKGAGSLSAGPYVIIKALEDSTVTVVSNWVGASNPETVVIPAFGTVEGVFATITWVSGKIVAYK